MMNERIANEVQKGSIKTSYGYAMELRGLIDRFDINIASCQTQYAGVESRAKYLKQDRDGRRLLAAVNVAICVLLVVFVYCFFNIITFFFSVIAAFYLFIYTVRTILTYRKAKVRYQVFTEHPKYAKMIKKEHIATYYNQTEYFSRYIAYLKKGRKTCSELLKKVEACNELTQEDISALDSMAGFNFSFEENTFHEFKI